MSHILIDNDPESVLGAGATMADLLSFAARVQRSAAARFPSRAVRLSICPLGGNEAG